MSGVFKILLRFARYIVCVHQHTHTHTHTHSLTHSLTLFVGVIHIEQCQVVAVDVSKPHLGLVGLLLGLVGSHEDLRHWREHVRHG